MHDDLGKRIKEQYEHRTRYFLPRRTYTIIRVDGKAFHTFTRGFKRPFDTRLMRVMDNTAKAMCEQIQGAQLAYVQSDEISILLTDFAKPTSDAWFDGNIQKVSSISASIATIEFNLGMYLDEDLLLNMTENKANFDSRVFTIPDPVEVENYFIWRQQDATRNSIQMAARANYSHKECSNRNTSQLQDMLHEKGINWNNYTAREKRGGWVIKKTRTKTVETPKGTQTIERPTWVSEGAPIFTKERDLLRNKIPRLGEEIEKVQL